MSSYDLPASLVHIRGGCLEPLLCYAALWDAMQLGLHGAIRYSRSYSGIAASQTACFKTKPPYQATISCGWIRAVQV